MDDEGYSREEVEWMLRKLGELTVRRLYAMGCKTQALEALHEWRAGGYVGLELRSKGAVIPAWATKEMGLGDIGDVVVFGNPEEPGWLGGDDDTTWDQTF